VNIKLKAIELDSFRAYKDKQLFNFTNEKGEIVNLIVIFAPNGFGKTSLLDAIEWGLSKEINRFSNNGVLKKVTKLEKEFILKNRDSENSCGVIKFIDDKDDALILNTQVRGRKYRSDYNEGLVIEDSSELRLLRDSVLAKDNILSHDKIDSFLLVSSGADRYEALSKFWDYSNDTENYKTIFLLWNEIKKEITSNRKLLKKLAKDIKDVYIPSDALNLIIDRINNFKIEGVHLTDISDDLTEEELNEFVMNVISQKSEVLNKERKLHKEYSDIDQLYYLLKEYNQKVILQLELESRLEETEKGINEYTFIKVLNDQSEEINKESLNILKKLNKVDILKQKADYFRNANAKIVKIEKEIIEDEKDRLKLKKINNELSSQILEIQYNSEKNRKTYNNYIEESNNINQKIAEYKRLDTALLKVRKKLAKINNVINERSKNLQVARNEINEIEALLHSDIDTLSSYEFKKDDYLETVNTLKRIKFSLDVMHEQRKKKKEEYEQFGKLNDDLNKIRKIGRQIIQNTEKTECPLCSTSFSNFEVLIDQVDKNITDVFKLKLINEEIQKLERDIEDLNTDYKNLLSFLKDRIKDQLGVVQAKNSKEYKKFTKSTSFLERISREEAHINNRLKVLTDYFIGHNPLFNKENFGKDTQIINDSFLELIKEKKQLIQEEEQQLHKLNEEFNKNKELILSLEKHNIEKEAISKFLKSEQDYQTVSSYLKSFDISIDNESMLEKERHLREELNLIEERKLKIQRSIQSIQANQTGKELYELQLTLQSLKDEYTKCKGFVEKYLAKYKKSLNTNEVNESTFLKKINSIKKEIESANQLLSYFDNLHEKIQYTREVLENSSKVKEKNDLIVHLEKLNELELHVKKSLKDSQKIIIEKIKKAFNLNVINKIYSRIEPHPDLNFMEIVPVFIDDKPSLEIYAPMGEERKDNPIIFFSSAQLDILSLSIFFAKALMEPEPLLNTIFMDDPVHHMDSVNVLSFIDLLRTIALDFDRQLVITTHNESLFKLIQQKINPSYCNSKFIELDSHGRVAQSDI
jgi:DNA repair protein SbcC/Rad50